MKTLFFYFFLAILLMDVVPFFAQTGGQKEVNQIQPIIMAIPYTRASEDMRTVLDSSVTLRVAIIKVQEAFDNRGFTTVDYVAKLNASKTDNTFTMLNQSDFKSSIVEASGADIYVEVEADIQKGAGGNSVRLNLKAYDAFTGRTMGSKTAKSNQVQTDQFDRLVENALKKTESGTETLILDDFLNVMQLKFDDIVENGRTVKVIFELDPNASVNFESEIGSSDDQLADKLEDWIEENAYKQVYNQQGKTDKQMTFEVRIPLRDQSNNNFTPRKFTRQLRKFCDSLSPAETPASKLKVKDETRGGTIYITFK
jgi:hypothetical protein